MRQGHKKTNKLVSVMGGAMSHYTGFSHLTADEEERPRLHRSLGWKRENRQATRRVLRIRPSDWDKLEDEDFGPFDADWIRYLGNQSARDEWYDYDHYDPEDWRHECWYLEWELGVRYPGYHVSRTQHDWYRLSWLCHQQYCSSESDVERIWKAYIAKRVRKAIEASRLSRLSSSWPHFGA